MKALPFVKMEGLGNDFVLLDRVGAERFTREAISRICDRRRGVGADGVLFVEPPSSDAAARMIVRNADGSRPEMCGTGLRCVAFHLVAQGGARRGVDVVIETDAGSRRCRVDAGPQGADVDAEMGVVRVVEERALEVAGERVEATVVDAGNPHAVLFRTNPAGDLPRLGPALAKDRSFANGVNVELVAWNGPVLTVFVWERGVGPTLACGTGACAVAAAAVRRGGLKSGQEVRVRLPGGDLLVSHDAHTGETRMRGPARVAFRGEVSP